MSFPTEADFALIKIGDGATPTENFVLLCGIENVTINEQVNTTDRFRRDCAKPGSVPKRRSRVTGEQWEVSGSGVANIDQIDLLTAAKGIEKNYQIEFGQRDGTDAGTIIATASGSAILTARTINGTQEDGTMEITLTGQDDLDWDVAT
jgi:hypothetical protein